MAFVSMNPATGEILEHIDEHSSSDIQRLLHRAAATFRQWRGVSFERRAALMRNAADVLETQRERYARSITLEMGKPIVQSRAEIDKCATVCRHYAQYAEEMLAEEAVASDATRSYVRFDPLGPVLAVMPWNFPFWQVFRFAAPALMAGNTALLKHASNVPRCALSIEEVFIEAGFPEGCFTTLMIPSKFVNDVIDHPSVVAVTLTGSETAGSQVAARAGMRLKKSVLELGGSDPFIVLADADVEMAARVAATARMINAGQSCIAAKRFIVEDSVYEAFLRGFIDAISEMIVGDPMDDATDVGSLAREDLLLELHEQLRRSVEKGARLVLGGHRIDRPGSFYAPTVLEMEHRDVPAWTEETFGPVAAVYRVHDADEAIDAANDSDFGLGASLWTTNLERASQLAGRIHAGAVFVNGLVKSDPRLPFGGVGKSGYGRELSVYGIREFVNVKTVWMA